MDGLCLKTGLMTSQIIVSDVRTTPAKVPAAVGRSPANGSASKWSFPMKHPFKSLWPVGRNRFEAVSQNDVVSVEEGDEENKGVGGERRDGNWVLKILQLRALRDREDGNENGEKSDEIDEKSGGFGKKSDDFDERSECFGEECGVCGEGEEGDVVVDKGLFSKMLRRVNLGEARLYAQLSYLGSLAYSIPRIEPGNLLKYHGFHFVTSSVEKQEQALKAEIEKVSKEILEKEKGSADSKKKEKVSDEIQEDEKGSADSKKKEKVLKKIQENEKGSADSERKEKVSAEVLGKENNIAGKSKEEEATGDQETEEEPKDMANADEEKERENQLSAYIAYRIAASAASYLLYHTTNLLPFKDSNVEVREDLSKDSVGNAGMLNNVDMMNGDVASLIATTDSVTSVVAAKEAVKQAVADDLNSTSSTPCEWFVCDDDQTTTRFFVIQGSESLASWQANLLFEPVKFEGLDVLVHRGIYEAAKGIYEQMLPEVRDHVKNHGNHAMFRFTGHSLGGSLSLLVNLMLLIRGDVPPSLLLPVVTFGAPAIMCGGDRLLQKLGLPKSHVQSICMHRDIVPRAFSCNYPSHVTELLKAVNGKFRGHPCLEDNGLLYFPMGEFLILQPDENFSPHHELLPSGCGLYLLTCPTPDAKEAEKHIRAAQVAFLNTPHPLEILSDRSSYGSEGAILRDHDMTSYLKTIQNFIRQELNQVRKTRREHRRKFLWPLIGPSNLNEDASVGSPIASSTSSKNEQFNFAGVLHTGRESFRRLTKLLTSRHMHVVIVFLFPARILILGAYNMINFH